MLLAIPCKMTLQLSRICLRVILTVTCQSISCEFVGSTLFRSYGSSATMQHCPRTFRCAPLPPSLHLAGGEGPDRPECSSRGTRHIYEAPPGGVEDQGMPADFTDVILVPGRRGHPPRPRAPPRSRPCASRLSLARLSPARGLNEIRGGRPVVPPEPEPMEDFATEPAESDR